MEAGAAYARAHDLHSGIALTALQMAALTTDIVWLVEQTVVLADGSSKTTVSHRSKYRFWPVKFRAPTSN